MHNTPGGDVYRNFVHLSPALFLLKFRGAAMFTFYCQLILDCRLIGCWVADLFYSRQYMHRLVRFAVTDCFYAHTIRALRLKIRHIKSRTYEIIPTDFVHTLYDVKDTQSTHSRKNRLLLAIISHFTKSRCIKYTRMID